MPAIWKVKPTNFKCPICGSKCVQEIKTNLFACMRPIVSAQGSVSGSCGRFSSNGVKFK